MLATRSPETTRRVLLETAFGQIHRNGFRATSLDHILSETGLTKGALYHHFANKMLLGYAVVEEILIEATRRMWLEPVRLSEDPIEAMIGTFHTAEESLGDRIELGCPVANLALEMSPVDEGFRDRIRALYTLWTDGYAEQIERGQRRGLVRPELDPASTARFIVASVEGCFTVAKNAGSREVMADCFGRLSDYLRTLET